MPTFTSALPEHPRAAGRRRARPGRALTWLGLVVGLLVLVAACASGSADTSSSATTSAGATSASRTPSAQAYSSCMRTHGVPDFPDPDANGRTVVTGEIADEATLESANNACASLRPSGTTSGSGSSSQLLKFAQCMRENGVPSFPDPTSGGAITIGGVDPNSPEFQAAMAKCQSLLPNGPLGGGQ